MNPGQKKSEKYQSIFRIIILFLIILAINFIGNFIYKRFDLTKEKRYSLASPSISLLKKLNQRVLIKVYLDGDLPSGFLRLKNSTKDILQEFKAYSNNKIEFEFIDPFKNAKSDAEKKAIYEQLLDKGLLPTNLKLKSDESYTEKIIFPSLLVSIGESSVPVQLLENQIGYSPDQALNNSVILLEYKISNAIKKIVRRDAPMISFIQSYGSLPEKNLADIKSTLSKAKYRIETVDITAKRPTGTGDSVSNWINELTDVLVIAKPQIPFSEKDKFRIDQFIMKGGKVLWLIDPMKADMDMLRSAEMMFTAQGVDLNLDDMLFRYGVRLNKNLLQDAQLNNPIPIIDQSNMQPMLFPWLYFPLLTPSANHPIGRNLDPIASYFSSSIDTIASIGIKKSILLTTSMYSRALPDPVRVHLSAIKEKPDFKYFKQRDIPVGVLLEGKFTSVFKNRLDYLFLQKLTENNIKVLENGVESKMIIIADGDIIKNDADESGQIYPLGYNQYTQQTMSNKDFVMNCIEYLVDNDGLIASRNKEIKLRLLDKAKIKEEKTKWQLINIIFPLGMIIAFGIFYAYRRRKKYANWDFPRIIVWNLLLYYPYN